MEFDNTHIQMRSYQGYQLHKMREELHGEVNFDFITSFQVSRNFHQVIKACKNVVNKPTRINMKFETHDKKFQICFIEKSSFKKFAAFIVRYKEYILSIGGKRSDSLNSSIKPRFSYLLEPHGLYRLNYRWVKSLKLMIFRQEMQLKPRNSRDVLFKFEIHARKEPTPPANTSEIMKRLTHQRFDRDLTLTTSDLMLVSSRTSLLNFTSEDQKQLREGLFRDIDFLTMEGLTNYSIRLIVEKGDLYHFGICDYYQRYSDLSYFGKKLSLTPEDYGKKMKNILNRHVLIQ